ncbi:DUF2147 domain-containing protein [Bacterioplanoides pacificum]|uniref:DUF2147 domain-containing protein n=1 Tax=Bacterioplanoides pacificum TaxID=1171596 RepID=A0ABV7VTW4_9GAMM
MKKVLTMAALGLMSFSSVADIAEGRWVTIDDEDGSQASVVEIKVSQDGELKGTIVKLLREKDQGKSCEECPDEFHNQPIEGLTFMWGLEREGEGEWRSGRILDPKSGSIYKSKLDVAEDGQSLEVRGYIGVSWIGRSQEWLRYDEPVSAAVESLPADAADSDTAAAVEAVSEAAAAQAESASKAVAAE